MSTETLQFRIRGFTPETLPLKRLAEYMAELADLLGADSGASFDKVVVGSATPQVRVPSEQLPRTLQRVMSVLHDGGPPDARKAYRRINGMLAENGTSAQLRYRRGGNIIAFPGVRERQPGSIEVSQFSEIDGVVIRVGGRDETIPVHLRDLDGEVYLCNVTSQELARDLARRLFDQERPIRAVGDGKWHRDEDGRWKLKSMRISSYRDLDTVPVDQLLTALRSLPGNGWNAVDDVDREVHRLRYGE